MFKEAPEHPQGADQHLDSLSQTLLRESKWRIMLENGASRYFGRREIRASEQRRLLKEKGYLKRTRRRNNGEASIYHLTHTLKGTKTIYRVQSQPTMGLGQGAVGQYAQN